jgi:hypothetical protein
VPIAGEKPISQLCSTMSMSFLCLRKGVGQRLASIGLCRKVESLVRDSIVVKKAINSSVNINIALLETNRVSKIF